MTRRGPSDRPRGASGSALKPDRHSGSVVRKDLSSGTTGYVPRIGARIHREIVFNLAATSVVGQIDAAIQTFHLDARVIWNRVPPFRRIVSQEEIRGRVQKLSAMDVRILVRPTRNAYERLCRQLSRIA